MIFICSSKKVAQYFKDVVDDASEMPNYIEDELQIGDQGSINDVNFEDYSADDDVIADMGQDNVDWTTEVPRTIDEVPEDVKEIIYDEPDALVIDGINKNEVISFDYVNRKGFYAGYRTVEPHYLFTARTTNNLVLVSYDLDVGDIRTFILQNNSNIKVSKDSGGKILPNGVRYEGWNFARRPEIDIGSNAAIVNTQ